MFAGGDEIKCSNYWSSEFIFPYQLKKNVAVKKEKKNTWKTTADTSEMWSTAP